MELDRFQTLSFLGRGSTRINTDLIVNDKEKSVKSVFPCPRKFGCGRRLRYERDS